MKSTTLLFILLSSGLLTFSQQTTISVSIPASHKTTSAMLFSANMAETYRHEVGDWFWHIDTPLVHGKAVFSPALKAPLYLILSIENLPQANLFISPGDQLSITWQGSGPQKGYIVTGRGSHNNQDITGKPEFNPDQYQKDTLPGRVLAALRAMYRKDSVALQSYIAAHHPSQAYIDARKADLAYFVPDVFYSYLGNHRFTLRRLGSYKTLKPLWDHALDSILAGIKMSNDEALISSHYTNLINTFLLRKKEALWDQMGNENEKFRKEWCQDETDSGKALLADIENLLTAKIINRYFTGQAAELAYAHMIHKSVGEKEDNLLAIHNSFVTQFPNSAYRPFLDPELAPLREKESRPLTDKMILIPNGTSYKTFDEIKQLVKGKTVLLDMWGTWCGPCRKEINEHSQALKDHFKGKEVVFLYVANFDLGNESKWKALIPYYNLEGTHLLASQELTQNINEVTKMKGYPSYIIIKKDGSFELSKAGYPMDRDKLIKQIEGVL